MTSVVVHGWEIIAGSVDGTVRRFDVRMGRVYTDDVQHPVTSVATSHDGMCVLAACLDSTLRLLDKSTGKLLSTYTGHVHSSVKMDCSLTPSDAYVVGCSETGKSWHQSKLVMPISVAEDHVVSVTVVVHNEQGELLCKACAKPVQSMWHNNQSLVVFIFLYAGDVLFWDLVESEIVRSFRAHSGVVCSMAIHPEGTSMVTSSLDGTVKVWTTP